MSSVRKDYLIFTAAFAGLGSYLYGYDVGMVAAVLTMQTFNERFNPSPAIQGAVVSIMCAGGFLGAAAAGWASDTFGRKRTIALGSIVALAGYALQAGSFTIVQFLFGRAVTGVAIGLFTMVVPLYNSELAPPKIRGFIVGVGGVMTGIGYIGGQWVGYGCQFFPDERQWRVAIGLQLVTAALLLCGMQFFPFSPRWLLEKGREEEARAIVLRLHRSKDGTTDEAEAEFINMRDTIYAERLMKGRLSDLWATPVLRRRTFVACSATIFNQFSGISVTSYYGPSIYRALGITSDKLLLLQGIYGAISAIANAIFVTFILDSVGRKKPLLFGSASMICIFSVLSALISSFPPGEIINAGAQWSSVAMIFLVPVVFSMSYDPTSSLLASEVFPTQYRSVGMALAICCNWAVNILLTEVSPIALANIGWKYYLVFIVLNVISFVVVLRVFPETKGRSLEDIAVRWVDVGHTGTPQATPSVVSGDQIDNVAVLERGQKRSLSTDLSGIEKYPIDA